MVFLFFFLNLNGVPSLTKSKINNIVEYWSGNNDLKLQGLILAVDQNEDAGNGHIRHENFESVGEETPESTEACCICQVI